MSSILKIQLAVLTLFLLGLIDPYLKAADTVATIASSAGQINGEETDLNKTLTNPVTDIWPITFQQNNDELQTISGQSDRWSSSVQFQPVCQYLSPRTGIL